MEVIAGFYWLADKIVAIGLPLMVFDWAANKLGLQVGTMKKK